MILSAVGSIWEYDKDSDRCLDFFMERLCGWYTSLDEDELLLALL